MVYLSLVVTVVPGQRDADPSVGSSVTSGLSCKPRLGARVVATLPVLALRTTAPSVVGTITSC